MFTYLQHDDSRSQAIVVILKCCSRKWGLVKRLHCAIGYLVIVVLGILCKDSAMDEDELQPIASPINISPACTTQHHVPKRLHQIWLQGESAIPQQYLLHMSSWRKKNPTWEFRVWDEVSLREFIVARQPDVLNYFDTYDNHGIRSDIGRVVLLSHLGGVYADIDVKCLRPLDGLLQMSDGSAIGSFFVGRSIPPTRWVGPPENISHVSNYFIAASPRHPFLESMMSTWNQSYVDLESKPVVWQELNFAGPRKWQSLMTLWNTQAQTTQCIVQALPDETFVRYSGRITNSTFGKHEYSNEWLPPTYWLLQDLYLANHELGYDAILLYSICVFTMRFFFLSCQGRLAGVLQ